jgi:uncharacterized protein YecE (DUF72 family)
VGNDFRFSVKMPKAITHVKQLENCLPELEGFLSECFALGHHLGCLLVQLPPSLVFDPNIAGGFFAALRRRYSGAVVIEPRHESWVDAQALLMDQRIGQAAVDPSRLPGDDAPGGWPGIRYWRLHGSPQIYFSTYGEDWLEILSQRLVCAAEEGVPVWCIFDNTARDAALGNALSVQGLLK